MHRDRPQVAAFLIAGRSVLLSAKSIPNALIYNGLFDI
jgi:hypothetical protein